MRFSREILPFCKTLEFPYLNSQFVLNNEKIGKPIPIPLPVIRDKIYAPTRYIKALLFYNRYNCIRLSSNFDANDLVYIPPPFNLKIFFHWLEIIATELQTWKRYYIPHLYFAPQSIFEYPRIVPQNLAGMTILDAGAGCGETAWLYFKYGAKKVICIEPDIDRFNLICENIKSNHWNAVAINDYLRPEYLNPAEVHFAKIDIEGAEVNFIKELQNVPCVIETHTERIHSLFVKSGFTTVWNNHRGVCLVTHN